MVSVDVKHHVYLLTNTTRLCNHNLCTCTPWCGNSLLVSSLQTLQAHKQHNFHWTVFPFPLSSITNKILRVRAHATKQCHLPKDIIGTIRCKKRKGKKEDLTSLRRSVNRRSMDVVLELSSSRSRVNRPSSLWWSSRILATCDHRNAITDTKQNKRIFMCVTSFKCY